MQKVTWYSFLEDYHFNIDTKVFHYKIAWVFQDRL